MNISYAGVKEIFAFDSHVLITKNINPFLIERKIYDVKDREMIQMFWSECVDQSFYRHISKIENFMYLNDKNVLYLRVADIVWNHLEEDGERFGNMR